MGDGCVVSVSVGQRFGVAEKVSSEPDEIEEIKERLKKLENRGNVNE